MEVELSEKEADFTEFWSLAVHYILPLLQFTDLAESELAGMRMNAVGT